MKKLLVIALALSAITSCDVIETPIIPNDNGFRSDLYEVPEFEENTDLTKYILLEEFTGHFCGNCPGAALTASDLAQNERVVLMSVHAGGLAEPNGNFLYDFTTESGDAWWAQMVSPNLPCARIDRLDTQADWFVPAEWEDNMTDALAQSADARAQIITEFAEDLGHVNIHVETEFLNDLSGQYRMVVALLESSILSPQLNYTGTGNPDYPSPTAYEYEHNHTFRSTVNGANGVQVGQDPVAGETIVNSYTVNWNNEWQLENCEVLAIIISNDTGAVVNLAHVDL